MPEQAVIDQSVEVPVADGIADAVLYRPDGEGRWPGFLCLTDIVGIRPASEEHARRIAAEGFAVLLPNLFYREGKRAGFRPKPSATPEENRAEMMRLVGSVTPEKAVSDGGAYLDFLSKQPFVEPGPMGVAGYCFSGSIAIRIAAAFPDRIAAAASFHGGRLATESPDSPHTLLPKVRARLYFGHAVEDPSMPAEMIASLNAALAQWGRSYESELYEGAHHGWTMSDSAAFNPPQAERAFEKLIDLLHGTVKHSN